MTTTKPIEVKKDGLSQSQDGTWKLRLTVHPEDMPVELMTAPMGSRYAMALVLIGEDEMPVQKPEMPVQKPEMPKRLKKCWDAINPSQQAYLSCTNPEFQAWLGVNSEMDAAAEIRLRCGIGSRATLDTDGVARSAWNHIYQEFASGTGRVTEQR